MSLLTYPKFQVPELDGTNLSGGKVYFYIAGTTTFKDTYSDSALTTANTNPVILDARGEWDIYLNGVYKIILKDADDVEIWTKDNSVGLETNKSSNDVVAPTVTDDSDGGYTVEWLWVDTVLKKAHICVDSTVGAAVWERLDSPLSNAVATTNPTVTDDSDSGYEVNSPWTNITLDSYFICVDASVGAAVWKETTAAPSTIYEGTAAGTADALTATLTPTLASLADKSIISIRALLANTTTTPTLASDGLTAWTIVKNGSQALAVGDIAGVDHELWLKINSGNSEYELLNPAREQLPVNHLSGLTISNNVTDSDHDIDIDVGKAKDSSDAYDLSLTSIMVKQIDVAWAVGTAAGGLFSGTVAIDTWYHLFLIRKDSDGSIDAGFDTSVTAANIPTGYTAYKWIGAVLTDGSSNILPFYHRANAPDEFIFDARAVDFSGAISNTRALTTVSTPLGIQSTVLMSLTHRQTVGTTGYFWAKSADETDAAASESNCTTSFYDTAGGDSSMSNDVEVMTNTSSQIAVRSSSATGVIMNGQTRGFRVNRGAV